MKRWYLSIQSSLMSSPACDISKVEKIPKLGKFLFLIHISDPPNADYERGKTHACMNKQRLVFVLLLIGWKSESLLLLAGSCCTTPLNQSESLTDKLDQPMKIFVITFICAQLYTNLQCHVIKKPSLAKNCNQNHLPQMKMHALKLSIMVKLLHNYAHW